MSHSVHSLYHRHPADLPSLGEEVRLDLLVRRFYCGNSACPRRTFAEPFPRLLAPRARRTRRLALAQARVGITCGGEAGARLLHRLAMPASGDTVLRLMRALPLPGSTMPRAVGVDDWALKKGQTYGTILVDLEARRVLDLLPDRTAATVAEWLKSRPTVEVIARDRSTEYARAAVAGAPQAIQVADRWHLLKNLREMIERWLAGIHGRLRSLPAVASDQTVPPRRTQAYPRSRAEAAVTAESRARRLAQYNEVQSRFGAGEKLLAISQSMGLARGTVRRYAYAATFPERATRVPARSRLDPYLGYLENRLATGCEDAAALWREIKALGYTGAAKQVRRWVSQRRTAPARTTPRRWRSRPSTAEPVPASGVIPALPSPRQLSWLSVLSPQALDAAATASLDRIVQDPEVAGVLALVRRLTALIRSCCIHSDSAPADPLGSLESWLMEAGSCGVAAVETFTAGLRQDEAEVKAALTSPWSSGQMEGQINKLKLIKRQMYGRANLDLLRRRVLLAV